MATQQHLKKATPEQRIAKLEAELAVERLRSAALGKQLSAATDAGLKASRMSIDLSNALSKLINER